MNREEILALEGLELRKAVGLLKGYTTRYLPDDPVMSELIDPDGHIVGDGYTDEGAWGLAPAFESDIAAAWPLLESLPSWHLYRSIKFDGVAVEWRETACFARTEGRTAMQAICRAYLLAKET